MAYKENYKLRKPGGEHTVGCASFEYVYEQEEMKCKRRIPCLCFYPSNVKDGLGRSKNYISSNLNPEAGNIMTNSYWDIPILLGKHPLLFYSHGLGSYLEENTVLFEELASNGYIVLSIGHEGSGLLEMKNGDILIWDSTAYSESIKNNQFANDYDNWFEKNCEYASIEEQRKKYQEYINGNPYCMNLLNIWVKDSLAALEMFLDYNAEKSNKILEHVDTNKIAAWGMSFGGVTALRLIAESKLFKAGVNMDGIYRNTEWNIDKPFMFMCRDEYGAIAQRVLPLLNTAGDFYSVKTKNCKHPNFTDLNEILSSDDDGDLGNIDPDIMKRIMNTLILDFFNKYLKYGQSPYLDSSFLDEHVTVSKM
jgi:hypothetical protein